VLPPRIRPGQLSGAASGPTFSLSISTTVIDGGTSFVGLANDKSGNCIGDLQGSGLVALQTTVIFTLSSVFCAHYVASSRDGSGPKMRVAIADAALTNYIVFRISDGGPQGTDTISGFGAVSTLAEARAWVNTGFQGWGGVPLQPWTPQTLSLGDFTITP
jgi:hypothetical protein